MRSCQRLLPGVGGVILSVMASMPLSCALAARAAPGLGGPFPCCSAPMSKKGRPRFEGASWLGSADEPRLLHRSDPPGRSFLATAYGAALAAGSPCLGGLTWVLAPVL